MLKVEQISQIKNILASDRLKIGGHEVIVVANLLVALEQEEQRLLREDRVRPVDIPRGNDGLGGPRPRVPGPQDPPTPAGHKEVG